MKIIVIKNGTVMEKGTHEELLTHGKLYADLFHIQTKDIITDLKAVHLFSADKE